MKLEAGKWYRQRDGGVVGPLVSRKSPLYTFGLGRDGDDEIKWTSKGLWLATHSSDRDLVEEVPAPVDDELVTSTFGQLEDYLPNIVNDKDVMEPFVQPAKSLVEPVDADSLIHVSTRSEVVNIPQTRATEIASRAADLVGGDRDRQHGQKHDNFSRIALMWNAWLKTRREPAENLTAHDVGVMMALMKAARTQSGTFNIDDYIDACGYMACAGEVGSLT